MTLVPMDNTNITTVVKNDALQLRAFLDWVSQRFSVYNQNCTVGNMTAAGIASGDQTFILALISDLNRIKTLASGTVPGTADDINYNINALVGLM